jgi:hypothetical protein
MSAYSKTVSQRPCCWFVHLFSRSIFIDSRQRSTCLQKLISERLQYIPFDKRGSGRKGTSKSDKITVLCSEGPRTFFVVTALLAPVGSSLFHHLSFQSQMFSLFPDTSNNVNVTSGCHWTSVGSGMLVWGRKLGVWGRKSSSPGTLWDLSLSDVPKTRVRAHRSCNPPPGCWMTFCSEKW